MKTNIKMQFNPKIAKDLGVEEAIMYSNIEFWVCKNSVNEKHYHDDYYWTYNTLAAFEKLFTFWTSRQINRILNKLEKNGYIKIGNYNKVKYDRTKWYTCISPNGKMDITKRSNGSHQTVKPIPDNKPNSKPDNPIGASLDTTEDTLEKIMGNNINEVMNVFYEADKLSSGGSFFGRKTYREDSRKLINEFGLKDTLELVKLAILVRDKPYAPVITNPTELRSKFVKLKSYMQKENGKEKKIFWGTDFSKQ